MAARKFNARQQNQSLTYTATSSGYYSIWVKGVNLPDSSHSWWFNLQNTYTAPQKPLAGFNETSELVSQVYNTKLKKKEHDN
jgi:hypothetical protein